MGDNQWKTISVVLHNPIINQSGISGSDFMLVNTDGIDDIFHGIEVDIARTVVTTSVPELSDFSEYTIFPNPNNGQFTISLPDNNAEITITDMLGQQVLKMQATQKTTNLQLDKNGVYIIFITTKQGTAARRLIVNR